MKDFAKSVIEGLNLIVKSASDSTIDLVLDASDEGKLSIGIVVTFTIGDIKVEAPSQGESETENGR